MTRIDLHAHSSVSDGTDDPATLVHRAADAGLSVVAVTDHDSYDGWASAYEAADDAGVTVVGGVEMSTQLGGAAVHVLAYLPDPTYEPLTAELDRIRADRAGRIASIVDRLRALGIDVTVEDVRAVAADASSLGRPHVADALIANGFATSRTEAFNRWLSERGPAFVPKYAPSTESAVRLIRDAGGAAVIAHPWGRSSRPCLTPDVIAGLAASGLVGLEVDHQDHTPDDRLSLRALASDLDLVMTGSSDYHGTGKVGHALGTETTEPGEYERLLERVTVAAARAGRPNPPSPVGTGAR